MIDNEEHLGCIVGAVVQLREADCEQIHQSLSQCEGLEIHGQDEQSRLVITLEAATNRAVMCLSEHIQNIEGVLYVTPVYQYCENMPKEEQSGGWQWR
ncbi:MAG: chaperone NapD [Mariprofundaceae bacterium]|nr:chaperone NapD [Mariprofundaceae bacterium]